MLINITNTNLLAHSTKSHDKANQMSKTRKVRKVNNCFFFPKS